MQNRHYAMQSCGPSLPLWVIRVALVASVNRPHVRSASESDRIAASPRHVAKGYKLTSPHGTHGPVAQKALSGLATTPTWQRLGMSGLIALVGQAGNL